MTTYALESYNLNNSLCWGNSIQHLQRACDGPWSVRIIHVFIGLLECIPVLGQIISLFEQCIVENCFVPSVTTPPTITTQSSQSSQNGQTLPSTQSQAPPSTQSQTAPSTESQASSSTPMRTIVYIPITGNPPHLGHMSAIDRTIRKLQSLGVIVEEAVVGLSSQSYLESKNAAIKLTLEQRQSLTRAAITDAPEVGMFAGVRVSLLRDPEGPGEHGEVYRTLVRQEQARGAAARNVILAAGADLAIRMHNWPNIPFAAIVGRAGASQNSVLDPTPPGTVRWLVEPDSRYAAISSTAIRNGDLSGFGREGRRIWTSEVLPQQTPQHTAA